MRLLWTVDMHRASVDVRHCAVKRTSQQVSKQSLHSHSMWQELLMGVFSLIGWAPLDSTSLCVELVAANPVTSGKPLHVCSSSIANSVLASCSILLGTHCHPSQRDRGVECREGGDALGCAEGKGKHWGRGRWVVSGGKGRKGDYPFWLELLTFYKNHK